MDRIRIVGGDITKLEVDVIVNAANSSLLGGGGVDGAIHRAAGPGLLDECRLLDGCKTGSAKMTGGHSLPATHVVHTVGPVWRGGSANEDALLASCYRESLELAVAHDARSIAFPAISCGVYGFPIRRAAGIAVAEVAGFLTGNDQLEQVLLVAFENDVRSALEEALEAVRSQHSPPAGGTRS